MLHAGKISQGTFDLMEKKLDRVTSIVSDLKEALEREESFWQSGLSEQERILESLLTELELKHLLGEITEDEWTRKSMIINSGLDSLKNNKNLANNVKPTPVPPIQTTLQEHANEKMGIEKETREKPERRATKKRRQLESPPAAGRHCMNPWKPECEDTDIELSIYYKGHMTPICRGCWEELSRKNIEWSSL